MQVELEEDIHTQDPVLNVQVGEERTATQCPDTYAFNLDGEQVEVQLTTDQWRAAIGYGSAQRSGRQRRVDQAEQTLLQTGWTPDQLDVAGRLAQARHDEWTRGLTRELLDRKFPDIKHQLSPEIQKAQQRRAVLFSAQHLAKHVTGEASLDREKMEGWRQLALKSGMSHEEFTQAVRDEEARQKRTRAERTADQAKPTESVPEEPETPPAPTILFGSREV